MPAGGSIIDGIWLSAPVAAYVLEIEKVTGGFIAGAIALLALGAAVYRFLYWRARPVDVQGLPVPNSPSRLRSRVSGNAKLRLGQASPV